MTAVLAACVLALCVLGVFHKAFHDNLLQRLGMCAMSLAAGAELYRSIQFEADEPAVTLMLAGLTLFGVGVVVKVWRFEYAARH